jgi:hypothetical protein
LKCSTTVGRLAEVAPLHPQDKPESFTRIGWIVGTSAQGRPLVDFADNTAGPLEAESTIDATPRDLEAAAQRRQSVVLVFEGGEPRSPIVRGFIVQTLPAAELPALTEASSPALPEVAQVDGKRVSIEGKDEIVLSCGEASITLRRNGKIILRGTYLESHSEGTNRIKGGAVQVN